jgi:hypothetical protein
MDIPLMLIVGTICALLIISFIIGCVKGKWIAWGYVVEFISMLNPFKR